MLNNPIVFMRDDYCTKCNTSEIIELYNIRNQPVGYTRLLDKPELLEHIMSTNELSYFRCKSCGETHGIYWRRYIVDNNLFPMPFRDLDILKNFEIDYLGGKRI